MQISRGIAITPGHCVIHLAWYNILDMTTDDKSLAIILIEKLRLIESEIFLISSKHGVKTIDELDLFVKKGKLSEETLGEDLFMFDTLLTEKQDIEKKLAKLSISKDKVWENLQSLLGLPKLSFQK